MQRTVVPFYSKIRKKLGYNFFLYYIIESEVYIPRVLVPAMAAARETEKTSS